MLMQLYDGELPPEQTVAMEERLAESAELGGVWEGLEQLGEVVRAVAYSRAGAADDIADAVMARIEAERSASVALRAIEGGVVAQPAGQPERTRSAPASARGRRVAGGILGAVAALAAAVALLANWGRLPGEAERAVEELSASVTRMVPQPPASQAPTEDPEVAAEGELVLAVAIEAVDFGSRNGSIFVVPSGEFATPVIWLVDEPAESGDTMGPL